MRINIGPIPTDPRFDPSSREGWRQLREPSPGVLMLLSIPVSALLAVGFWTVWSALLPELRDRSFVAGIFLSWKPLLVLAAVVVVHELTHLVFHPGLGATNDSVVAGWPRAAMFYAHYLGAMRRNRLVLILLAPFLMLSIIPLMGQALRGVGNTDAALFSVVNAFAASGGLLGVALLLRQVPATAEVRNQGFFTYWRDNQGRDLVTE